MINCVFNLISNPVYFQTWLKSNYVGWFHVNIYIVLGLLYLGILLGVFVGPEGVAIGYPLSIQVGVLITIGMYHNYQQIEAP